MKDRYSISEYIRNPETKRQFLVFFFIGAMALAGCQRKAESAVIPVMFVWIALGVLHFAEAFFRYRRIAGLSYGIDKILHMEEIVLLSDMREGELSILENEVNKLLIRLKEQNGQLRRDKAYLADALADLSHQLRTPLTSMNLIFSIMETESLSEEKRREYEAKLRMLLHKVQWLIEVLLKMSKLDADAVIFEKKSYSLQELVHEAAAPMEIPMELKGISLGTVFEEKASFSGDFKWTAEAVENIIKNCMEHTKEGGTVTISARENALYSELIIEDNGEGIAKEDLSHLFERFYKGKNSSEENAGIGLALANAIITKQKGTLKAENRREGGARFTIRFYKGIL